jgi:dTMP kinase
LDRGTLTAKRGRLIAIEGIDQSGKRVQSGLLAKKLTRNGHSTSVWSFPDYSTPLGKQLRAYLAGRSHFDYHAAHLLYAANKWEKVQVLERELRSGRNIIVNRYTPSNLAYGVAHGLPLHWVESLEKGLPKPDIVFVLNITTQTSFVRKKRRRDFHESNLNYLNRVRRAYIRLAPRYGWKVIYGNREPASVHSDLWSQASRFLRVRRTHR